MTDIEPLIADLKRMPHGSARVEAARELWSRAQQHDNPRLRFKAIAEALEAASFGGAADYFLSLFPQMVRLKQEHPEAVDMHTYAWRIKWLVGKLPGFPEVPENRIEEAHQLHLKTLQEAGASPRTAIYMRWQNAMDMGRLEQAATLREEFQPLRRDQHADCHACEVNALVREAVWSDQYNEAKSIAEPITLRRMKCAEVPHATYGLLALPALLHGEADVAALHYRKGYPLVRSNVGDLGIVGEHFAYLAALGEEDRFLRMLRGHSGWLAQNHAPRSHLDFFTGAAAGLQMLAESGKRKRPLKLELPPRLTQAWGESLPVATLAENFEAEARKLTTAYDRRNGNPWHTERLDLTLRRIREQRQKMAA